MAGEHTHLEQARGGLQALEEGHHAVVVGLEVEGHHGQRLLVDELDEARAVRDGRLVERLGGHDLGRGDELRKRGEGWFGVIVLSTQGRGSKTVIW